MSFQKVSSVPRADLLLLELLRKTVTVGRMIFIQSYKQHMFQLVKSQGLVAIIECRHTWIDKQVCRAETIT